MPARRVPLDDRGRPARARPARCTSRRRRTSPTPTTSAPLLAAGIDDWGGVSPVTPDHVNPERPVARARRCCATRPRPPGKTLAPRLTVYPEYVRDADRVARPRRALRGARARPTSKASRATTRGPPAATTRAAARCSRRRTPARAGGRRSARCSTACSPARRSASTRSSRCSARAAPSLLEVARGRRRAAPRDRRRRRHVRAQPQHQLHERLHVQVPVLRVLEGPALAQPPRRPVPARARGDAAPRASRRSSAARPRCACRAASTPTSTATTTSTSPGR